MSTVRFTSRSGRDETFKSRDWGGPIGPLTTARTLQAEPLAPEKAPRGELDNRRSGAPHTQQHRRCTP